MKEQSKYVIIGNSTAAVAAIEGIRSVDQTGGILVIGDEKALCIRAASHLLLPARHDGCRTDALPARNLL